MNVRKIHIWKIEKIGIYPTLSINRKEYMNLRNFLNEKFKLNLKECNDINYDRQKSIAYRSSDMSIYLFPISDSKGGSYKVLSEFYIYIPLFITMSNTSQIYYDTLGDLLSTLNVKIQVLDSISRIKLDSNKPCIKYRNLIFYISYHRYNDLIDILPIEDVVSLLHHNIYTIEHATNSNKTCKIVTSSSNYKLSPCKIL